VIEETSAPVMARVEEEPSLFGEEMPPRPANPAPVMDDGLPAPAYRPEEDQPEPVAEAPRARPAPGTPTAEALARLERVTGRAAGAMAQHRPGPARTSAPANASGEERPRFGINTLINRMAGHDTARPAAQATRPQPPVTARDLEAEAEEERIEIPAFLRRQAN
jgi:cell division protein FtsZ